MSPVIARLISDWPEGAGGGGGAFCAVITPMPAPHETAIKKNLTGLIDCVPGSYLFALVIERQVNGQMIVWKYRGQRLQFRREIQGALRRKIQGSEIAGTLDLNVGDLPTAQNRELQPDRACRVLLLNPVASDAHHHIAQILRAAEVLHIQGTTDPTAATAREAESHAAHAGVDVRAAFLRFRPA